MVQDTPSSQDATTIQIWDSYLKKSKRYARTRLFELEFRDSDESPGKTDDKQGILVKLISSLKSYFRETYNSQKINLISPTPEFTLGIIQIKTKSLSTSFQYLVQ